MSKLSLSILPPLFLLFIAAVSFVFASDDEERLMMDVFKGYNSLILPLRNDSQPIIVRMTLQLVLLINVDEKDQIMHTNVWLTLKWKDFQMAWSPVNYGGIKEIRVSPDKVWLPDIVLFNNADGNYEVSFMSNVIVDYRGNMLWVPPAIYKSSCIIDVEYFPFDEQVCHLIFGSWTYNENEIKMEFAQADSMDLSEYAKSVSSIWDVIDAPASLVNRRSRIEYQLRIRRKTLFYTVVLIIPTVLMAFLSMAVFFLPTDSGEKMTLGCSSTLRGRRVGRGGLERDRVQD
uniref:Neur_chan_LBD domain-containing protein n=1 Tax=Globodera pallida TaxID=36090 RepID=A0A183C240_GLOPA